MSTAAIQTRHIVGSLQFEYVTGNGHFLRFGVKILWPVSPMCSPLSIVFAPTRPCGHRLIFDACCFCIYPSYCDTSPLRSLLSASVSARFDTIHTQQCRGRHFNFLPCLLRQIYAYACFRACKLSPSHLHAYFLTLFLCSAVPFWCHP